PFGSTFSFVAVLRPHSEGGLNTGPLFLARIVLGVFTAGPPCPLPGLFIRAVCFLIPGIGGGRGPPPVSAFFIVSEPEPPIRSEPEPPLMFLLRKALPCRAIAPTAAAFLGADTEVPSVLTGFLTT